jgi:hypothetical protein
MAAADRSFTCGKRQSNPLFWSESLLNDLTINGVQGEAYTDALDLAGQAASLEISGPNSPLALFAFW